jgi:dTDP-4-amino-4,6-dideoxygalactose transaminase
MTVPFLDLRPTHSEIDDELKDAINRVVESGLFILGREVAEFETEFAAYVGANACVGVGNGLDALELGLRALGVAPGDEVIVPSNTFIATWLAVTRMGGVPVPVEPRVDTYNIDPDLVAEAITRRTRAIIAVHLYGQPADMAALRALADERGLWLIEDAAQAHGAAVAGKRVGALGHVAAWSFYPAKNLGALGDGGAVTTDDEGIAARVRGLGNYGSSSKYVHDTPGFNSRLDELQAAVLRVKLRHLAAWNRRRAQVAASYAERLGDAEVVLPAVEPWAEPVWHLYVIRAARRDALASHLYSEGIRTVIHYPIPPHRQGAYGTNAMGSFPIAERLASEVLSLPMGPHLADTDVDQVVDSVLRFRR